MGIRGPFLNHVAPSKSGKLEHPEDTFEERTMGDDHVTYHKLQ